jgi:hypothetical protein
LVEVEHPLIVFNLFKGDRSGEQKNVHDLTRIKHAGPVFREVLKKGGSFGYMISRIQRRPFVHSNPAEMFSPALTKTIRWVLHHL